LLCTGWCFLQAVHLEEVSYLFSFEKKGVESLMAFAVPLLGIPDARDPYLWRTEMGLGQISSLQSLDRRVCLFMGSSLWGR
jgi:hypothetical protein